MTVVIAISGPSASGKSTLATRLSERLGDAVHLQQDLFFVDPSQCDPSANFCEPRYLNGDEFCEAVKRLAGRREAVVPAIDFRTFQRTGVNTLLPASVVIVEGMTVLRYREVCSLCRMAFYLATPWNVIAARKRARDASSRDKTVEIIEHQLKWMRTERDHDLLDIQSRRDQGVTVRVLDGIDTNSEVELIVNDLRPFLGQA